MFFRNEADVLSALPAFGESKLSLETWEHIEPVDGSVVARLPMGVNPAHWLSIAIPRWFSPARGWLLWVSQTGVFPSMELLHLYYTLRASHGDREDVRRSPGHEFLGHEVQDLRSFLFLSLSSGWDAHLLTYGGPGRAYFSHDGWFRFSTDLRLLPGALDELREVEAEVW